MDETTEFNYSYQVRLKVMKKRIRNVIWDWENFKGDRKFILEDILKEPSCSFVCEPKDKAPPNKSDEA